MQFYFIHVIYYIPGRGGHCRQYVPAALSWWLCQLQVHLPLPLVPAAPSQSKETQGQEVKTIITEGQTSGFCFVFSRQSTPRILPH